MPDKGGVDRLFLFLGTIGGIMPITGKYYEPGTPIAHRSLSRDTFLTDGRLQQYGLHPLCMGCRAECDEPQYAAPGLERFECEDYKED